MGTSKRDTNSRSRAQALFGTEKKVDEFREAREKERQEDAAKTARLRDLRLAKEDADRKMAAAAAATRRKSPR
ncbi:MAG: hypothetical protein ACREEL_06695 [Stellaceae bacterium]